MTLRNRKLTRVLGLALLPILLLTSCAGREGGASAAVVAPTSSPPQPVPITLRFFHWLGDDAGPQIAEIDRRFAAANPGIEIEFETLQLDEYTPVLNRRLAVADLPDLIGVGASSPQDPHALASYLLDLSGEPWVKRLQPDALQAASDGGRVYALPLGQATIGVVYNKKVFRDLGLGVPQSWDEFLVACQKIKAAGVAPIALAASSHWVGRLIPFAMAASTIYRDDPGFDRKIAGGQASFSGSGWQQIMADYLDLGKRGYFNEGARGTTYDQSVELMATGRAAMVVNGAWIVTAIEEGNPAVELGMFPLPYGTPGTPDRVPAGVLSMIAISASTRHPAEARKYLDFLARPDILPLLLAAEGEGSPLRDVTATFDPAVAEIRAYTGDGASGSLGRDWPAATRNTLYHGVLRMFEGNLTGEGLLQAMDKTLPR